MPAIRVLFGDHWFEILVQDYVFVSQESKDDLQECVICIYGQDPESGLKDQWILGNAFMRGYYVTHDREKKSFGIVP